MKSVVKCQHIFCLVYLSSYVKRHDISNRLLLLHSLLSVQLWFSNLFLVTEHTKAVTHCTEHQEKLILYAIVRTRNNIISEIYAHYIITRPNEV